MCKKWWVLIIILLGVGCGQPGEIIEVELTRFEVKTAVPDPTVTNTPEYFPIGPKIIRVTATPTPTPSLFKNLIVCEAQEPDSLYLYNSTMLATENVHHAIYENLYTNLGFEYQPQGLEKMPSLADGDARLQPVEVVAGDLVVDANGDVVPLANGVTIITANGQRTTFDGSPLTLPQLTVDFTLKPMVWSDGTAVTADDSVYSFELNQAADSVKNQEVLAKTAVYEATGELTLRWVGLPGFLDQTYFLNVWTPLPRHHLGQFAPESMAEQPEAAQMPLSNGPFVIKEWESGWKITLVKNPHYYRAGEGLPLLDQVSILYQPDTSGIIGPLLSGQCDIVTQDALNMGLIPFLLEAELSNLLASQIVPGMVWEHIDFGIDGVAGNGRYPWFEDARVRQAVMMCTNRQQMIDELTYGTANIFHAYVPDEHPLLPEDIKRWPYDVLAANALLDEVGFVDQDGDGVREAPDGTPFTVPLLTTVGSQLRPSISELFAAQMRDCGIEVALAYLPAGDMFADGPDSPLFGRKFDLALFAWLTGNVPTCDLYHSDQIPGPGADGFVGWDGSNNTGWRNSAFDAACDAAQLALPGMPAYETSHQEALRIFAEELPVIPLFSRLKISAARPEVKNFHLDSSQPSELWNLYELDIE
ncbi:MAG: peptide ABC transporter substrate-binding protein [Chloroflexi bacterium]|nr:MAG: peptide ABC transporter substrate-binding protein [Chloroflexota bacterium]